MNAPPGVRFDPSGIEIHGGLCWLDSRRPRPFGIVTHAHVDHLARHETILCTPETAALARGRTGPGPRYIEIPCGQATAVGDLGVTLLPAGHILGSAMVFLEGPHGTILYSGDYRAEGGLTCPPAEPRQADFLITESTFGRPDHRFPPAEASRAAMVAFARESLSKGRTPVFLAYSLGKGQEVLATLTLADVPVDAHGAIWSLCEIYREFGVRFPGARRLTSESARGRAVVAPPRAKRCAEIRRLAPATVAAVTGWGDRALGEGIDLSFRLSDHADFDGLLGLAEQVRPKRVFTLHGYAREFAEALRERGFDAEAVPGHGGPDEEEQPGMFSASPNTP